MKPVAKVVYLSLKNNIILNIHVIVLLIVFSTERNIPYSICGHVYKVTPTKFYVHTYKGQSVTVKDLRKTAAAILLVFNFDNHDLNEHACSL